MRTKATLLVLLTCAMVCLRPSTPIAEDRAARKTVTGVIESIAPEVGDIVVKLDGGDTLKICDVYHYFSVVSEYLEISISSADFAARLKNFDEFQKGDLVEIVYLEGHTEVESFKRLPSTGDTAQRIDSKTSSVQPVDIHQLLNDYLLFAVSVYNSGTTGYLGPNAQRSDNLAVEYLPAGTGGLYAAPEVRADLERHAQQIADTYGIPVREKLENPFFHFPRNECRGKVDKETKLLVPEFLDVWVDPMKLAGIKETGKFPEIQFKGFCTSLSKDKDQFRVVFSTGARAMRDDTYYVFKDAKWIETKKD
ncbi:MAG: hypothetical protein AMJ92_00575 [candidate division Zixibacteria bacterium SM23_81]|nr:MAG: hypothetical protein AMJ92_00575 [candidate division Zixibacteria bacterium SM23_81]